MCHNSLGGIVLREAADLTPVLAGTLLGQEGERTVTWVLELTVLQGGCEWKGRGRVWRGRGGWRETAFFTCRAGVDSIAVVQSIGP